MLCNLGHKVVNTQAEILGNLVAIMKINSSG